MSGLEGLAAIAAATQLLEYTFRTVLSVARIRERILVAPEQFDRYAREISQLVIATRAVERNHALQTPEIHEHLSATLSDLVAAQQILDTFSKPKHKRWYLKVAIGTLQRNIVDHLNNLHRTSTQLLVCIGSMNSQKLANVEETLAELIRLNEQPRAIAIGSPDSSQQSDIAALEYNQSLMMDRSTYIRMPSGVNSKRNGHSFGKVTIKGNSCVTNGNVTGAVGSKPGPIETRSHQFENIEVTGTVEGNPKVVNGDIGPGFGQHQILEMSVDGGSVVNGNVDSIDTWKAYLDSGQSVMEPLQTGVAGMMVGKYDKAEGDDVVMGNTENAA